MSVLVGAVYSEVPCLRRGLLNIGYVLNETNTDVHVTGPPGALLFDRDQRLH